MNDLQIDYFLAVATNLSFTRTSEELYVSQPAISRQIALLEKELDAKLFIRNNQRTELTEAGRLYFDLFRRYKSELASTKYEASLLEGRNSRVIKVGFLEGWDLSGIIPPMMEAFKREYPESNVIVNCCGAKDLSASLINESMDIVVTLKNSVDSILGAEFTDVAELGKILLFSSSHPLAGSEDLTLKDFKDEVFIAPWEVIDKLIIDTIAGYTRPYGFIPNLTFVKNHESAITCIRNNMGVGIFDDWVWAKRAPDLCSISFNSKDTVTIARLKNINDPQTLAFEDILASVIRKKGDSV